MKTSHTVYPTKNDTIRAYTHVSEGNPKNDTVSLMIGDVTFYLSFGESWDEDRMRFGPFADAVIHAIEKAFEDRDERRAELEDKKKEEAEDVDA